MVGNRIFQTDNYVYELPVPTNVDPNTYLLPVGSPPGSPGGLDGGLDESNLYSVISAYEQPEQPGNVDYMLPVKFVSCDDIYSYSGHNGDRINPLYDASFTDTHSETESNTQVVAYDLGSTDNGVYALAEKPVKTTTAVLYDIGENNTGLYADNFSTATKPSINVSVYDLGHNEDLGYIRVTDNDDSHVLTNTSLTNTSLTNTSLTMTSLTMPSLTMTSLTRGAMSGDTATISSTKHLYKDVSDNHGQYESNYQTALFRKSNAALTYDTDLDTDLDIDLEGAALRGSFPDTPGEYLHFYSSWVHPGEPILTGFGEADDL